MADVMEIVNQPVVAIVKLVHRDKVVQFLPVIVQNAIQNAHLLVKIVVIHIAEILVLGHVVMIVHRIVWGAAEEMDVHKVVLLDVYHSVEIVVHQPVIVGVGTNLQLYVVEDACVVVIAIVFVAHRHVVVSVQVIVPISVQVIVKIVV